MKGINILTAVWLMAWIAHATPNSQISSLEIVLLVSAIILISCNFIILLFDFEFSLKVTTVFSLILVAITVAGSALLHWAIFVQESQSVVAVTAGAILATFGWLVTSYLNLRNHVKQHTMNILLQLRESKSIQEHVQNVLKRFPRDVLLTKEDVDQLREELKDRKNDDLPVWESIRYIANYYEFLAIGIKHGDIDQRMLKDSYQNLLTGFCEKVAPFIQYARERDAEKQKIDVQSVNTYQHLLDLNERWRHSAKTTPSVVF